MCLSLKYLVRFYRDVPLMKNCTSNNINNIFTKLVVLLFFVFSLWLKVWKNQEILNTVTQHYTLLLAPTTDDHVKSYVNYCHHLCPWSLAFSTIILTPLTRRVMQDNTITFCPFMTFVLLSCEHTFCNVEKLNLNLGVVVIVW